MEAAASCDCDDAAVVKLLMTKRVETVVVITGPSPMRPRSEFKKQYGHTGTPSHNHRVGKNKGKDKNRDTRLHVSAILTKLLL